MDWVDYYISIAFLASLRSPDAQTKHGCVLTDRKNRVLSIGFNGFPRGIYDKDLPRTRPDKYPWFSHAERNALANCQLRPDDAIAYVTGQCCNECIMALHQHGITKVVMADRKGSEILNDDTKLIFDDFIYRSGMEISYVRPDFSWIEQLQSTYTM